MISSEPLFDRSNIIDLLEIGGRTLLVDLVCLYGNELARLRHELDAALESHDLPLAGRTAHQISGASANLGATRLTANARSLERLAATGDFDGATAVNRAITASAIDTIADLDDQIRHLTADSPP